MVSISTEMIKEVVADMIDEVVEAGMGDVESNEVSQLVDVSVLIMKLCLLL